MSVVVHDRHGDAHAHPEADAAIVDQGHLFIQSGKGNESMGRAIYAPGHWTSADNGKVIESEVLDVLVEAIEALRREDDGVRTLRLFKSADVITVTVTR